MRKLPFPDGAIIAALHYRFVPSEENNKAFGQAQSFVAADPTNVQFMIKGSKTYASTGGWGFGHFNQDGSPAIRCSRPARPATRRRLVILSSLGTRADGMLDRDS
jgi:hypothetical protein